MPVTPDQALRNLDDVRLDNISQKIDACLSDPYKMAFVYKKDGYEVHEDKWPTTYTFSIDVAISYDEAVFIANVYRKVGWHIAFISIYSCEETTFCFSESELQGKTQYYVEAYPQKSLEIP